MDKFLSHQDLITNFCAEICGTGSQSEVLNIWYYVVVICSLDPGIEATTCACEILYVFSTSME